jgi:hypothetical protein
MICPGHSSLTALCHLRADAARNDIAINAAIGKEIASKRAYGDNGIEASSIDHVSNSGQIERTVRCIVSRENDASVRPPQSCDQAFEQTWLIWEMKIMQMHNACSDLARSKKALCDEGINILFGRSRAKDNATVVL